MPKRWRDSTVAPGRLARIAVRLARMGVATAIGRRGGSSRKKPGHAANIRRVENWNSLSLAALYRHIKSSAD